MTSAGCGWQARAVDDDDDATGKRDGRAADIRRRPPRQRRRTGNRIILHPVDSTRLH